MSQVDAVVKNEHKTKEPSLYKVVLLNDDFTPIEFVIEVLKQIFDKNHQEAEQITMHIHNNGKGVAGIFALDIAKAKHQEVQQAARYHGHPLKSKIENA